MLSIKQLEDASKCGEFESCGECSCYYECDCGFKSVIAKTALKMNDNHLKEREKLSKRIKRLRQEKRKMAEYTVKLARSEWKRYEELESQKETLADTVNMLSPLIMECHELKALNRELTEILEPLVLRHDASEEFAKLNNVVDQFSKAFDVEMVVVEKGWFEKVKKLLAKCEEVK